MRLTTNYPLLVSTYQPPLSNCCAAGHGHVLSDAIDSERMLVGYLEVVLIVTWLSRPLQLAVAFGRFPRRSAVPPASSPSMSRSSLEKLRLAGTFPRCRETAGHLLPVFVEDLSLFIVHYPCTVYAFRSLRMLSTPMQPYIGTAVRLYLSPYHI